MIEAEKVPVSAKKEEPWLKINSIYNIIKRIVYARIPVKVEYELTKKGRDTAKIFLEMKEWNKRNL